MKRSILMIIGLCGIFCVAQAQSKSVVIKGKIDGISSGRLYLLAQTGSNQIDTLGTALFEAPDFVLGGIVKEPIVAQIVVEGYQGGFTLLAEPGARYRALLANGPEAYIRGGKLQDEWLDYKVYSDSLRKEAEALKGRYDLLREQNKFRSASLTNDSLTALENKIHQDTNDFLARHDDLITAYTIYANVLAKNCDLAECRRLYDTMGAGAKATLSARLMKEHIERLEKTETGIQAPDFTLPDLQGNMVTLSKIPGKIKILDFWASWCGPCRLNNPSLRKLYEDFHDKGLEIVSVSLDNKKERWGEAVAKDGLNWLNLSSLKGWGCEVARLYNVTAVPAIFILDESNRIIATHLRNEKLRTFLEERLK